MKRSILLLIIFLSLGCHAQLLRIFKKKPKTLDETFIYLDRILDDTTKYTYMSLPRDVISGRLYDYGFGMWIRNNWGLWGHSSLKKYFNKRGIFHPDIMSGIILTEYYRYLKHDTISPKPDTNLTESKWLLMSDSDRRAYYDSNRTSSKELFKYYKVSDTIVVLTSVTRKTIISKTQSSVRSLGVVKSYDHDKLVVNIIKIPLSKHEKAKYKVGEDIKTKPIWCELIPPRGWHWE